MRWPICGSRNSRAIGWGSLAAVVTWGSFLRLPVFRTAKEIIERRAFDQGRNIPFPPPACFDPGDAIFVKPVPQKSGRNTTDDSIGRNVPRDNGPRADDCPIPDLATPAKNRYSVANPYIISHHQRVVLIKGDGVDTNHSEACVIEKGVKDWTFDRVVASSHDQAGSNRAVGANLCTLRQNTGRQN